VHGYGRGCRLAWWRMGGWVEPARMSCTGVLAAVRLGKPWPDWAFRTTGPQ
jgi:hypothetical protein